MSRILDFPSQRLVVFLVQESQVSSTKIQKSKFKKRKRKEVQVFTLPLPPPQKSETERIKEVQGPLLFACLTSAVSNTCKFAHTFHDIKWVHWMIQNANTYNYVLLVRLSPNFTAFRTVTGYFPDISIVCHNVIFVHSLLNLNTLIQENTLWTVTGNSYKICGWKRMISVEKQRFENHTSGKTECAKWPQNDIEHYQVKGVPYIPLVPTESQISSSFSMSNSFAFFCVLITHWPKF